MSGHMMQISDDTLLSALPLLLLDGLLSQRHVLHVLLQPVQRRVRLHADPVIVILRVPSEIQDEKHEMRRSRSVSTRGEVRAILTGFLSGGFATP